MALQIRRGTEAQRASAGTAFAAGELIYTTDRAQLFIGDGSTLGGRNVLANAAGTGLAYNPNTGKLDINQSNLGFDTDDIVEGTNKKFFTSARAAEAAKDMLVNGTHTGIEYTWRGDTNTLDVSITGAATSLVTDTNPMLGGNLSLNSRNITGTGNIDINGSIKSSSGLGGNLSLNSYNITGSGNVNITGSIAASVGLGANLSLNSYSINGTGGISITGTVSASTVTGTTATLGGATFTSDSLTTGSGYFDFGSPLNDQNLRVYGGASQIGISDGSAQAASYLTIESSKGTLATPTPFTNLEFGSGVKLTMYTGSSYTTKGFIVSQIEQASTNNTLPGRIVFAVHDASGNYSIGAAVTSRKLVQSNGFIAYPYATTAARDAALTDASSPNPSPGTIIFVTDNGSGIAKFQGWTGTEWVNLH